MKSRNKLIIRWVFYLLGLLILALGIMLNTKAYPWCFTNNFSAVFDISYHRI